MPSLPGFVAYVNSSIHVPLGLTHLYYICFLSGFVISATVYCTLHFLFPVPAVEHFVKNAPSPGLLMDEYRDRWDRGEEVENTVVEIPKI